MIAASSYKKTNDALNWARDLNKQILMENIQMANKQMKQVLDNINYQENILQLQ